MSETLPAEIIVGIDTHKHIHAAVAITTLGARLDTMTIPVGGKGYHALELWARSLGPIRAFGVEGTGSYGAALSRFLCERGHAVVEVNRPNRQLRYQQGKSDPLDAEAAARAVLSGQAEGCPNIRFGDGGDDQARQGRSRHGGQGSNPGNVHASILIVTAPLGLRERLDALSGKMTLLRYVAALRPGPLASTKASAKIGLRALARRWLALDEEIKAYDIHLEQLTRQAAPDLVELPGIGTSTAAEMLLLVGDNPERIRSVAAFAKLCGACPIPASSGKTSRHRLNRGGNRQANAALYRVVVTRMRGHLPTLDYVKRRIIEGKSKPEIIRCLKRYVAREIFGHLCAAPLPAKTATNTA
ncbi:transposase [Lichenifustis flavocetrariae]|uniref:Transposase n=1 Tax=Lichenifustis flavocetrariae TaxID=2949735 RepID=A0AA41Z2N4_9HYPH|nr:transposase [Lichenifustis flavocetrariae]MCW6513094.1 transposase [Lichenifustis flavocetrariae]